MMSITQKPKLTDKINTTCYKSINIYGQCKDNMIKVQ